MFLYRKPLKNYEKIHFGKSHRAEKIESDHLCWESDHLYWESAKKYLKGDLFPLD